MSESLYCRTCARIHRAGNLPKGLVATLLSRIITLTGIVVLIGMLPWVSGQDPAMALLRARSAEQEATPEALAAIRQSLGFDQGPVQLLLHWLSGLLQGDAGNSWISGRPVLPDMIQAAQVSLTLMLMSAVVTLLLPYYTEFAAPYLWGTCSWNSFGMLYYFAGFNGYLLLGHYLRNHNWTGRQLCGIGIPMFAIGYAVTFLGFRRMTSLPDFTDEMLELFFTYCSLNVVMMTIPVFMLCKRANFRSERIKKALANLTLCGFGVYMIHYFFTGPSVVLMRAIHVPIYLQIPCAAVVAFCTSWFLVAMAYRCFGKRTKWVLG